MDFGLTGLSPKFCMPTGGPWFESGAFFLRLAVLLSPGFSTRKNDVGSALRFVRLGQIQGGLAGFGTDAINRMIDSALTDQPVDE